MAGLAKPSLAAAETNFDRTISGDRVAIHNLVGTLRVVNGEGSSVTAEIALHGQDAERLHLEQGTLRDIPTLRVVYPSKKIHVDDFSGRSQFWVRDDGTLDGKTGEGHKVEITGRDGGLDASADIVVHVPRGKKVLVYWGHGSGSVRGTDATVSIDGASFSVSASDVRGSLRVSVGSGEVQVAHGGGDIHIETGSGDVTLSDIDGDGTKVETGSGTIHVTDVDLPNLSLETGSGDIRAESVRANRASLETGSGSVGLLLESDVDMLSVESGSGDLDISVPSEFGASVSMETGSGSLETEMPIDITSKSRTEVHGTIGDGRGKLALETGSGSITIRRAR